MFRIIILLFSVLVCTSALATTYPYPGQCTVALYSVSSATATNARTSITLDTSGYYQYGPYQVYPTGQTGYMAANWYKCNDSCNPKTNPGACWCLRSSTSAVTYAASVPPGTNVGSAAIINPANVSHIVSYLVCGNNCNQKTGQPIYDDNENYPVLVGLPYHAPYYQTVGACVEGCKAVPAGPVILNQYAADGSGYTIGPWAFTGDECTEGIPTPPDQPSPDDVCASQRNACEAQCAGKAYTFDCESGSCECFGAPSYNTDPPAEPTTPTIDPGAPSLPSNQTPTSDPGGDAQLGAQIQNQSKQIDQGNAQLGQLGAMNNKLGAVISNQAKQIGQGDKIIDNGRQQLGVLKDIRSELKKQSDVTAPGLPGQPEYDTALGDGKNWTEHDDYDAVGSQRAAREIQNFGNVQQGSPVQVFFSVSSSPVLSGTVRGQNISVAFNRPWMEDLYSYLKVILVSLAYLQVFFMINDVLVGRK